MHTIYAGFATDLDERSHLMHGGIFPTRLQMLVPHDMDVGAAVLVPHARGVGTSRDVPFAIA